MGQWVMGQWVKWVTVFDGSRGSWVTSCLPMTHQPNMNSVFSNRLRWSRRCQQLDRPLLSLAKEPSATDVPQPSASISHDNSATADAGDMPPTKKRKVSPFDWFQRASAPTDVSSASRLLHRHLWHR